MVEAWLAGEPLPDGLEPEPPLPLSVARIRRVLGAYPAAVQVGGSPYPGT
jgi:hypothetical protein